MLCYKVTCLLVKNRGTSLFFLLYHLFFVVMPRFGTWQSLLCSRINVKPFNNK
nr:MAG TPA: hypothetical protein [Caudoviricetes sp.]